MPEVVRDDLALLTERAGDERDPGPRGAVTGDRGARRTRLVVGMRMDKEQAPVISHAVQISTAHAPGQVVLTLGTWGSRCVSPGSYAHSDDRGPCLLYTSPSPRDG